MDDAAPVVAVGSGHGADTAGGTSPPSDRRGGAGAEGLPTPPGAGGGVTDRRVRIGGAVAAIGVVVAGWLWWGQPPTAGDPAEPFGPAALAAPTGDPPGTVAPTTIMVHVSGAVLHPGLVSVTPGARVADAIAAAGGASRSADVAAVNLAAPVADGEHITVPPVGSAPPASDEADRDGAAVQPDSLTDGSVSLNTASTTDLETLPGVGPVIAAQIVAHREAHGPFQAVEDLLDVPGIGEAKLAAIRDLVTVP